MEDQSETVAKAQCYFSFLSFTEWLLNRKDFRIEEHFYNHTQFLNADIKHHQLQK